MIRFLRHLAFGNWAVQSAFAGGGLESIRKAIAASEKLHDAEIVFAVSPAIEVVPLLKGAQIGDRAVETFSQLRVWDTAENNGVLIYLLLADRKIQVVADRGVSKYLGEAGLAALCVGTGQMMRRGKFEEAVKTIIDRLTEKLTLHYPPTGNSANELSDDPVIV